MVVQEGRSTVPHDLAARTTRDLVEGTDEAGGAVGHFTVINGAGAFSCCYKQDYLSHRLYNQILIHILYWFYTTFVVMDNI